MIDRSKKMTPEMLSKHGLCGLCGEGAALSTLIESSSDAIKVMDLDGEVLLWNKACERLYGWVADEAIGVCLPQVPLDMRTKALKDIRSIAAQGDSVEQENLAWRKDGSSFMVTLTILPLLDEDGHPSAILSIARRLIEDRELLRVHDSFVSAATQELLGPLTAILGYTQLLERSEVYENPIRRNSIIASLGERVSEIAELVNDMLLAVQLQDGEIVLKPEEVDLPALIADIVGRIEPSVEGRRLWVDYDGGGARAMLDATLISRVVKEFVSNAVTYSSEGDIVISVLNDEDYVVIQISDEGIGIEEKDLSRVFDRFFRADVDVGQRYYGAGVGLYLAKRIIEAHCGSVGAQSAPGSGSTFTVRLPIELDRE